MKHGGILTKVVGGAVATAVAAPVAAGICAGVILANTGIENAEFVGYSGEQGLTAEQLYNATNTFHYNGNPFDFVLNGEGNQDDVVKYRKFNNYYAASETEQRNDNAVSTALPQITFLTHGLNGGAFHWSNKETVNEDNDPIYKFAYSNSSLITQLSASIAGSAQVYWAKMQSHNTFKLYDLNNPNNIEKGVYQEEVTVSKLDSASPHIIVVFEANKDAKQGYNNEVYEEFNYVVSKLVYDIKCLNDGLLPKINLIGHSRGGLTNLQYALDHPDLVDSMFGLGTPYIGSTTAETKLGKRMQDSFGREDIIDDDVFLGYYNRWTNNRSIYQNIRAHALGGYSTVDFALLQLRNFAEKMYGISIGDDIFQYLCGVIKDKKDNIEDINNLTLFINKLFNIFDAPVNEILEVIKVLFKEIDDYKNDPVVRLQTVIHASSDMLLDNDILVDLRSQLGSGYGLDYNFNLYAKCFTKDEGKLSSPTQPAVVHNLEAQDPNFIGYILRNIDLGNTSGPVYRITDDNTVTLLGYRGAILSERFEVPREINGYKVTRIESEAFSNAFGTNLKEIVIPYTLKEIGKYAFANCNFKQVTFEEGSQLKVIEEGAFFNCQNLNKFHSQAEGTLAIPNNVEQVYKNAFFGAKNIRKITLPSGVSYLEREALAGLIGLTEINVESGNAVYRSESGNLYDRDGWLLQYCAGKTETEFSVPSAVQGVEITAIAKSAFADAKSLQAVNLSNVRIVDELAFNRCLNLQTVRGDSVYYVERNAFSSTPWYQDYEGDYVGIGKTLIEYRGTSDIVMLSEYSSVGAGAFAGNVNIKEIVLGKAVDYIGAMAFYECGNLKTVKLLRADTVAGLGDFAFPENESLVLCVPEPLLSTYEEHGVWKNYHLNALNTTVLFESNGGTQQEAVHLNYYQTIGELPEPTKTGYLFAGWFYDWKCEGTRIENSDLWERSDDTATLYAKWEAELYSVEYQCTGGEFTDEVYRNYTCETEYPFAIPVRVGYTFDGYVGWYYVDESGNKRQIADHNGRLTNLWNIDKNVRLYPEYNLITYRVHYEGLSNADSLFNIESDAFDLPKPTKSGYRFIGWYSDPDYKQRVYNVPHGSVGDKTVYAYFKKLYTVTFQNEGNKVLSVSMVLNETIQTPGAAKDNYDGVWNDGTNNYAFESSFTLKTEKNVTLYAVWTGKSYAITYCNTVGFRGDSAYVSAPYFYTYGVGLSFSGYKASFSSAYNNQTHYEFVGFYQNSELTTPYTRISTQDSGNKTVYLRWRLIIDHRYRSGLKEITDEYDVNDENEISKMPYDSVGIGLENDARYNNMVSMGIKYIHITLEMEMWEKNDGYQCIFVCKDNTGQYIDIAEEKRVFDIDGSFTEDNPYKFKVEYLIELDQLKKVGSLYIRYGADGHSYDTWCNNNVHINVQAVFDESDVKSVNGKHSIMY